MVVIQEKPSTNGNINFHFIPDAVAFRKIDNFTLHGKNQPVIEVTTRSEPYIMGCFSSSSSRDFALLRLKNSQDFIEVLDYNTYFCYSPLSMKQAEALIKEKTNTHWVTKQAKKIQKRFNYSQIEVYNLDAFIGMSYFAFQLFMDGVDIPISETLASVWSKTLAIPEYLEVQGVTGLQFFETVIKRHNERVSDWSNI